MKNMISAIKGWWEKYGPTKRRLIQIYSALLFNSYLKGYITGDIFKGVTKNFCTPGLNCYSCPGAVTSCPLGALQNAFASSQKTAPYYMLGIIMLLGVIFGRWICGWLCPFGLLQDLLHKIKTPKIKKNKFTKALSALKYVVLILFVVVLPIIYASPAFCKFICPAGTVGGAIGLLVNPNNEGLFDTLGPLFTWKFSLAVGIIVACVFIYRTFCRFLCPLGALYGFFNKFSLFGIKLEKDKCVNCGKCISVCKMDIHHVGDMECINCGECISVCPTKAISYKGAKIILPDNEIETAKTDEERHTVEESRTKRLKTIRIITSIVLIVALCFSLIYCNFINDIEKEEPPITEDEDNTIQVPVGNKVGQRCPTYSLDLVDGSGKVNVKDFKGKIVIINFWYVTCTGCVAELPDFNRIATDYADDVVVLTIHSTTNSKNEAPDFIKENYPGSNMIFAYDTPLPNDKYTDMYYDNLGGRGSYPRTLILDENGIIVYTVNGSPADVYKEGPEAIYNKLASIIDETKNK